MDFGIVVGTALLGHIQRQIQTSSATSGAWRQVCYKRASRLIDSQAHRQTVGVDYKKLLPSLTFKDGGAYRWHRYQLMRTSCL